MKKRLLAIFLLLLSSLLLVSCEKASKDYTPAKNGLDGYRDTGNSQVYYEIFVGGFSDSNKDGIGDLRGLINRLDYLNDGNENSGKSLGIDGIWLMPIMKSPTYHKYDVTNYKVVDPRYGTNDDMIELVKECDKRGIDVIIDLVLNHTSILNQWWKSAVEAINNGDLSNKYVGYYVFVKDNEKETGKRYYNKSIEKSGYYYEGNFDSSMPELNLDNTELREEIREICRYWLKDVGIKGFRLDAVKYFYLNDDQKCIAFLKWLRSVCEEYRSDCYIVGEDWSPEQHVAQYYSAISCFDFAMSGQEGYIVNCAKLVDSVSTYVNHLISYRALIRSYNADAIPTPFISNHDMDRCAGYLTTKTGDAQMAANLYILSPGTPFMYYGEEIGMKGSRGTANDDTNRRLAMLWGDKDTIKDPLGATYSSSLQTNGTVKSQLKDKKSLYNYYKNLIMIRKLNPEIALGEYEAIKSDIFYFGGYKATYNNKSVGVFHNTSETETVTIDLSQYGFSSLAQFIGLNNAKYENGVLTLGPKTTAILR